MKTPRQIMEEADAVRERSEAAAKVAYAIRNGYERVEAQVSGGVMSFFKKRNYAEDELFARLTESETEIIGVMAEALSKDLAKQANEIEARLAVKE